MYTVIEVLSFLASRWSLEKRRFDRGNMRWKRDSDRLERQIESESDPERCRQLQAELTNIDQDWDNAEVAFGNHLFPIAVKWCAGHTGFGSRFIHEAAVVGFDASWLNSDQEQQQPLWRELVSALMELPLDAWQTTGWAKSVLSVQPVCDASTPEQGQSLKSKGIGPRKSTSELFKSALQTHHGYEKGSVTNFEPASLRKIEQLSGGLISDTTAGRLLKKNFKSVDQYQADCLSKAITTKLTVLLGDGLHAFGTFDPTEGEIEDAEVE